MADLRYRFILCGIAALYLLLAVGGARTTLPWCDEAWFSSPALNLITAGYMGTSVLDPTADFRTNHIAGIDRYTYWIAPLYPVTQAAWYEVFGFSLFSLRMYSVAWGLVALASLCITLQILSGRRDVALLGTALLAIDFQFLWAASVGRMDMMCIALGHAAFASFLYFRTRNLAIAVLVSQSLVVAAGLTHPMGAGECLGLFFLTLYYDRSRIRIPHVALAAAPYVAGAVGWGLYILKDPALFVSQFGGNAAGRFAAVTSPLETLRLQIFERYLYMYGFAPDTQGFSHVKIVVLIAYAAGVAAALSIRGIREHKGYRALLLLAAVCFPTWMLIDRQIQSFYLVHFVMFLVAIFAVSVSWLWERALLPRWVLAAAVLLVVAVQLGTVGKRIQQNPYRNAYLATTEFLKQQASPSQLVIGSAELAFQLGFHSNVVDDYRLGFRSGKRPDFIVIDKNRYDEWIPLLKEQDPPAYRYATEMMSREFHLLLDRSAYKVYGRL
ncbi:MAG: hypothetical protein ABI822_18535 [Bryobacteraceae bacterium]